MRNSSALKLALLAGAVALMATPAAAQDYGYGPPGPSEAVTVVAPPLNSESTRLNGPLEKVSLSSTVPYSDLDLRTRSGARELRMRVRDTARDVCDQLADIYPVYQAQGTSCYKTALENATLRANAAIRDARYYRSYND
mgnify:CR=1 FL=1